MFRATRARRLPLAASASNWVSRTRTSASSAATKNPLRTTSAKTATIFNPLSMSASQFISEANLPKNEFQDVGQGNDSNLAPIAAKDDGQSLAAALHALQCVFQTHILFHVQGGPHKFRGGFIRVQIRQIQD